MNNPNSSHDVIISGIHLDLTPSLKFYVKEKMERLFRHDERIVRIRIDLECDAKHDKQHKFIAKATLQVRGPDIVATAFAEECHKAVDLLIDKLDHSIRKRHGMAKDKRNHPHAVEWDDVALPKAM
ncbi:MAG: ribosome-associated translation inhibitor RaiA [Candidatus Didemnitutus sp.]|nr:ribosome-associated translation inhibitor RaiA [Candidatus Didemnitutus sp.]